MDLSAEIVGIKYEPFLCRELETYDIRELGKALGKDATFILEVGKNRIAVSWWVSAKRTRSYPYARVYDSLGFSGNKITIIPVMKDEGKEGDRDFLQWDTISLMSLLNIYVIIAYYKDASRSRRFRHKITNQKFDVVHIKGEIQKLLSYKSDALHWNLAQVDKVGEIAQKSLNAYSEISSRLGVDMHSKRSAEKRIIELLKGKNEFMNLSRKLSKKAQKRETQTIQPKERLKGTKASITIRNFLGGFYYFTVDEIEIVGEKIYLIEGKHTRTGTLPSSGDIKDGLIKMILFTNLKNLKLIGEKYIPIPTLKLTVKTRFSEQKLSSSQLRFLDLLKEESLKNGFILRIE